MADLKTVLTETLRQHLACDCGEWAEDMDETVEHLADVLLGLSGVAVTQLPEPDDNHGDGIAFWTDQEVGVADGMVVARFDPGSEAIYYEPRAAKALAAALLAAGVFSEGATND